MGRSVRADEMLPNSSATCVNSPANDSHEHIFTVDLEEWFHGVELDPANWPSDSRLTMGLAPLTRLLDERRVRATFFVVGDVARRFPELVKGLLDAGHEIACHGHEHQLIYRQTPRQFRDDLRRARDAIADAIGHAPKGYRAPYFSVRKDSLWALDILAEEGFTWDCSVFPVVNDRYGIPRAPTTPFEIQLPIASIVEVPITTIPILGVNLAFSGGAYLRILPWEVQRAAWRRAQDLGRHVVLYVHPWELDPQHPRLRMSRRLAITHYANLAATKRRLATLLQRYRFGTISDVLFSKSESTIDGERFASWASQMARG
jgi:polysaccharide deacetylase family protein (PEP-CTERM system associated)